MIRRTIVVEGPLAFRSAQVAAARQGEEAVQIMALPRLAARPVGSFTWPARSRFGYGVMLHDSTDAPFGDKLAAMPLSSLRS